ncbi:hypothetical protein CRE_01176 [Caenorhabditis remanei]|uniref:Uncharacterized protein n=1 Tax=Caenorhabditis remanei TaxID=31234 RepID=E3MWE6_CAERE|nr:hypothetical protein CRE_01176 [Caenorhabditis remanei]
MSRALRRESILLRDLKLIRKLPSVKDSKKTKKTYTIVNYPIDNNKAYFSDEATGWVQAPNNSSKKANMKYYSNQN